MKLPKVVLLVIANGLFVAAHNAEISVQALSGDIVLDDDGVHGASCTLAACHNESSTSVPNNQSSTLSSSSVERRNTLSDGIVHELDLDNFHSIVGSSSFTIVLFYDPDELKLSERTDAYRKHVMLNRLALEFADMPQPQAFFLRNLKIHFVNSKVNFLTPQSIYI